MSAPADATTLSLDRRAAASSIALVGFGPDSLVEMTSDLIILWLFPASAAGVLGHSDAPAAGSAR